MTDAQSDPKIRHSVCPLRAAGEAVARCPFCAVGLRMRHGTGSRTQAKESEEAQMNPLERKCRKLVREWRAESLKDAWFYSRQLEAILPKKRKRKAKR